MITSLCVWAFFACRDDTTFRTFMGDDATWKYTDYPESEVHPRQNRKLSDIGVVAKGNTLWFHIITNEGE
jgi:hypothetical protein